ncbi:hypothetical protein [Streptomyces sp. NPDC058751]|uniref:hypothetical protein n=1 Tax=Streptomyces sp. NPDC058751 TaxID=3346623 RepID=UPI00368CC790
MAHVLHGGAMALVIRTARVRRTARGSVAPVVLMTRVSGMVAMVVVRAVVAVALVVGRFGRRAVVVRAMAGSTAVSLVSAVRVLRRSPCPTWNRGSGDQVTARRVEDVRDLPAPLHHDPYGGLRHRPLDGVQPLRVLRRRNAADDQQICGGWSTRQGPPSPAHLRLRLQPEFRRSGQGDRQHRGAAHRRTSQKAPQVHLNAPSRQA